MHAIRLGSAHVGSAHVGYAHVGSAQAPQGAPGATWGRPGRPRSIDAWSVIEATLAPPPVRATRWTSRLLAAHLAISASTVARAWRSYGMQPCDEEAFCFATSPRLMARVTDVVGVFASAQVTAIVLQVERADRSCAPLPSTADATDEPWVSTECRQAWADFLDEVRDACGTGQVQVIVGGSTPGSARWFAREAASRRLGVCLVDEPSALLPPCAVWLAIVQQRANAGIGSGAHAGVDSGAGLTAALGAVDRIGAFIEAPPAEDAARTWIGTAWDWLRPHPTNPSTASLRAWPS